MKNNKRKFTKIYIITAIISLILGLTIFGLVFFISGMGLGPACDGSALAAIILICGSGLIWVAREGFFDILSYGFRQMGSMIFSKKPSEFDDFSGYKEQQRAKREKQSNYYIVILIVGAAFLLALGVLEIIFHSF